jgi:Plant transposon protein
VKLPTHAETKVISQRFALRDFPGCVGSIDCMKIYWKICPTAWVVQYHGRERSRTIVLEAVVDDRWRFQHAFIGKPRSYNDINVLDSSPLRSAIIAGRWPSKVEYSIDYVTHNLGYVI